LFRPVGGAKIAADMSATRDAEAAESAPGAVAAGGVRSTWIALALATFLAGVGNLPLWRALATGPSAVGWPAIAAAALVLLAGFDLLLQALAWPFVLKPVGVVLLLLSAVTCQAMLDHGVLFDADMVRNVLQTDRAEAREFVTGRSVFFVGALGVLPAMLLLFTRIRYRPLRRELRLRALVVLGSLLAALAAFWPAYGALSLAMRADGRLRLLINPVAPLVALMDYERGGGDEQPRVLEPLAADARREPVGKGRLVFVLVLGETATASHFSLNGYERDTNPELRARDVLNFPRVTSCGTSTAESLPCLFSGLGLANYTHERATGRENLLDVLQRTGVAVAWLDNNSGSKGVGARAPTRTVDGARPDPEDDPWDQALVDALPAVLDGQPGDLFVVLHQKGSHGPAYFKRTPPEWKRWQPECSRPDLQNCPREEIVNAYDNTILYTDHILAELIDLLATRAGDAQFALLYVSDHGESLGENGVYLHGFPRWLAPEEQVHVPMVFWATPGFYAARGLQPAALRAAAGREYSHDNLFHSVLGAFGVKTAAYDAALDIFATAR
jgi:lipid A ethanolaminephosphotransferase